MTNAEIEKILMTEDIVPMGNFEAVKVNCIRSGEADAYPNVMVLKRIEQHSTMVEEAWAHVETVGKRYLRDRAPYFNTAISAELLKKYLSDLGFGKDQYQSYSLRKLGTNELEDYVGPVTREFFETLGVESFRQQHTMATNNWCTKIHRDHADFKTHGFRGMIPLSAPIYLGYIGAAGENLIYRLEPGYLYFANIAKPHRGLATDQNRLATMFQMASDKLLLLEQSSELEPMKDTSEIPSEMLPYEFLEA